VDESMKKKLDTVPKPLKELLEEYVTEDLRISEKLLHRNQV